MYQPTQLIKRLYGLHMDAKKIRRTINPDRPDLIEVATLLVKQTRRDLTNAQFDYARQRLQESAELLAAATTGMLTALDLDSDNGTWVTGEAQ